MYKKTNDVDDVRQRIDIGPGEPSRKGKQELEILGKAQIPTSRYTWRGVADINVAVAVAAILQILVSVLLICYSSRYYYEWPSTEGEESNLFDMKRFETCRLAATGLDPAGAQCSEWRETVAQALRKDITNTTWAIEDPSAEKDTWCHRIGCLKDFTVERSTLAAENAGPLGLMHWFFVGDVAWVTLVHLRSQMLFKPHAPTWAACRGPSQFMCLTIWYAICSMIAWWRVVARPGSTATGPRGISPYCWAVTCRAALSLGSHPFSCAFGPFQKLKRIFMGLLFIVGAAQMVTSFFIFGRSFFFFSEPYYRCLEEQSAMAAATGVHEGCSPAEVCGDSRVFELSVVGQYKGYLSLEHVFPSFVMAFFILNVVIEAIGNAPSQANRLIGWKGASDGRTCRMILALQCVGHVGLVVFTAGLGVYQSSRTWYADTTAPVAVNMACNVLYVRESS